MMSQQVCKRTNTLIREEYRIVALCDMRCGLKQELIPGVHVQLKTTCYDTFRARECRIFSRVPTFWFELQRQSTVIRWETRLGVGRWTFYVTLDPMRNDQTKRRHIRLQNLQRVRNLRIMGCSGRDCTCIIYPNGGVSAWSGGVVFEQER